MMGRLAARAYFLPAALFVGLFALLPVGVLFASGLAEGGGLAGIAAAAADPLNRAAFGNSLVQGGASAAAAVALGYPVGVFLGRYRWRGRGAVRAVLLVPFLLPSLVLVLGVRDALGPGGPVAALLPFAGPATAGVAGIVAVNVVYNVPVVVLLTAVGVESAPASLEDPLATLGASPLRRYRDVWGPPSWLGAAAGALLTFVFSALAFAAPLLLCGARCSTVEVRIFALDQTLLDPSGAALLALLTAAALLAPAAAYLALVGRLRRRSGGPPRPARPVPWRAPSSWGLAALTAILLVGVGTILGEVVLRGLRAAAPAGPPASAFGYLIGDAGTRVLGLPLVGALANTLVFAGAAAGVALLLGVLAGLPLGGGRGRAFPLEVLLFVPLVLSPVVLAFALAEFWRPLLGGSGAVWILVVVSQAILALPFALQGLGVALGRLPRGARDTAQSLGAGPFTAYLDTDLVDARPALLTAALFAFALGLGEFTATYFLATPAFTTVPVALYRVGALRATGPADALAAILVLLSLAVFLLIEVGGRRVEL